jgi:hypothetical protein
LALVVKALDPIMLLQELAALLVQQEVDKLRQVVELVRNAGATELLTSYTTGDGEPWPFYERFGFVPTGERDEAGEIILSLDLSTGVR